MSRPRYGRGTLRRDLAAAVRRLEPRPGSVLVLLDRRAAVARRPIAAALADAGLPARWISWSASERRKTLAALERLGRAAVRAGVDRRSLLLAAGGGVTTDLGGFLAATLLRGIRWGAIPTTLLGLVDAALGGKTAVDLPEGKNLLGAFHPPQFVIGDLALLRTLPAREWSCGLGEVLKSALIAGEPLLRRLERTPPADLRRPGAATLRIAQDCADLKMEVVEQDPRESGLRKVLNLGHSFGHALEAAAGYRRLAHGEAVALGILCALRFGEDAGLLERAFSTRVRGLARRLGLPAAFPGRLPATTDLRRLLQRDKKARSGNLELLIPVRAGEILLLECVAPAAAAAAIRRELGATPTPDASA
ncbi:MAG: 3-dehydroquinate synthase [Planctomycetota bacterium]|nr:MAG: 3-dehydroquinate synthase [Planctomycetota bacterium]